MCLFEEQVALVQDLVAERIPVEEWDDHDLVVINPDGFQGDERDIIVYSLSYDAKVMPQAAISARMQDQAHVQGMLNVAFTRARDEVHVFHTAAVEAFAFADGRPGALGDWLRHCAAIEAVPRSPVARSRLGNVDSEFEAEVADALRAMGLRVLHQYPACGFRVDLVAEREEDGARVAVECDGERYHLDEHGSLKVEDLERQAILERAGWRVVRIPYRKWIADPGAEVQRVLAAVDLEEKDELNGDGNGQDELDDASTSPKQLVITSAASGGRPATGSRERVTREEAALIEVLRDGGSNEEDVFLKVRDLLGRKALTQKLRGTVRDAAADLTRRKLIASEDGEYFLLPEGRTAQLQVFGTSAATIRRWSSGSRRYPAYRRRWR